MKKETLSKLRQGGSLTLLKNYMGKRMFFKIQLNKNKKRICWQRFVSGDRQNWIELNSCLSLHDIQGILTQQ